MGDRGSDRDDLGIRLGVDEARETIAGRAADARAESGVPLVEQDAAGCMGRVQSKLCQVIVELLDAGFIRHRWEGVGGAPGWVGRIVAPVPVHLVQLLGLGVVGLKVLIVDGPRGGDTVEVAQFAEVALPKSVEGGAVQFRGPPDVVVHLGLEGLAVLVVPGVGGDVPVVNKYGRGVPVLNLTG